VNGITCPECGQKLKCKRVDSKPNGEVCRRKDCINPNCPGRSPGPVAVETVEVIRSVWNLVNGRRRSRNGTKSHGLPVRFISSTGPK
jgi:hypothetical protein